MRTFILVDKSYDDEGNIIEETKINISVDNKNFISGDIYIKNKKEESIKQMKKEECAFYLRKNSQGYWQYVIPSTVYN